LSFLLTAYFLLHTVHCFWCALNLAPCTVFLLSAVSCILTSVFCFFRAYCLLLTVYWFYTHRVVTVFSSMNIFMEASLDFAVPTKDSLLDPRGKKA